MTSLSGVDSKVLAEGQLLRDSQVPCRPPASVHTFSPGKLNPSIQKKKIFKCLPPERVVCGKIPTSVSVLKGLLFILNA